MASSPSDNPTTAHVPDESVAADIVDSTSPVASAGNHSTSELDGAEQTVAAASAPVISEFELLGEIGRGGMGIVYRAHDSAVNRQVAIKVLQDRYRGNAEAIARFVEEGQVTGQLQHPGVPAIHKIGVLPDGSPFLAMKLIRGETLANHLADRAVDRARHVATFLQMAQTVGYAHSKRVIHRDLKPANVMVGQFGEVQVMDWGLAKVLSDNEHRTGSSSPERDACSLIETGRSSDPGSYTQAGSVLGTPAYMSPEQAGGEIQKLDERADVFGLGAVLCEILTGSPPYSGADVGEIRLQAVRGELESCFARLDQCGADAELASICKRCLARDLDARPRDAGEVASMLAAHLATVDQRLRRAEHDRAAADVRAAEQRKRRHWQAAAGIAGFLILAFIGAGAWWADRQASEREKDRAVAAERDRHEAAGALTSAEKALSARDLTTAELAMVQAVARVGAGSPPELRSRMESTSRDRDLVRDLREIEDLSWSPGDVSMPDPSEMSRRYDSVFNRYGLNVSESTPESVAESVSKSLVLQSLLAGLGDWFVADPARPRLRQLLDRLDPESNRIAIRSAIASGDEGRVKTLIATIDGSKVPPWFAASVGFHRMVPFEDGSRLMTAAWKANPTEYLLAYRIGLRLWGTSDDRLGEVLAWSRVAVALRPSSPFSHNLLGTAWRGMRNWSEAEASARRAVELGRSYPKYSGAHVGLGNVLLQKGDLEGAEASYRAALAIDPSAGATYFNVGLIYDRKGDLEKAETWHRKAVAAAQTRPFFSEVLANIVRRRAEIEKAKTQAPSRSEKAAGR